MIYNPNQMGKALLEAAIRHKVENYRGKGHNKKAHKNNYKSKRRK